MHDIWLRWSDVRELAKGRKVVLFGRSEDWVHKTTPYLPDGASYIVDNNTEYEGGEFKGLPVFLPKKLQEESEGAVFIVITTGAYQSVSDELVEAGYVPGKDFCATPILRDLKLFRDIHEYDQTVILASSDHSEKGSRRFSKAGGGIYTYQTGTHKIEKKMEGRFRQVVEGKDVLYTVEFLNNKLYVLSKNFEVIRSFEIPYANACGLDYYERDNAFVIANAADEIHFHDADTFEVKKKIHFSSKHKFEKAGHHHINDICVSGESLYVSYFSKSGNWKKEVFDGGIDELSLRDLEGERYTLMQDLWMPHSPKVLDGTLCYVESMKGRLYLGNRNLGAEFQGFVRGIAYDGTYYFVGQSEHMYLHRLIGESNNLMLNAGFYLLDPEKKISRFFSCPDFVNIHDVHVLSK